MASIRFIHSADLHLGSPFSGMKSLGAEQWKTLQNSTLAAFGRLMSYTLETRPDFLLIVGDIYDGEDRNLRAQHRFQQGMEQLHEAGIPVILSHGNHDHLSGGAASFELPPNVHVFQDSVENIALEVRGAMVKIAGFSYGRRHVTESMIEQYPRKEAGVIQLGMLHGSEESDTEHAVYAPFRKEQLLAKNYDYWALGHIHKRQQLSMDPPIVYPGNLQGRNRKESGPKGFYEVALTDGHANLKFIAAEAVRFERITINCSSVQHMNELFSIAKEQLEAHDAEALVAELELQNLDEATIHMLEDIPNAELVHALREALSEEERFVHISKVQLDRNILSEELSPFGKQLASRLESWEANDWKQALKELYNHPRSGRFLPQLDDGLQDELRAEAEAKIRKMMALGDQR
ncbi:DNA repair exonuclease [Planococcus sp. CP5-4]|uniref:metallophosphoesterase family protein n=1 Tax=unclassified Planococcus (in: firmicutes) TaxID=2662419 RepID=UPI001C21A947|nr:MULTISPECIES: DNA repair exonuclease [unclassified Planococcus (in: firmicutes)]MBU9674138.1 DNA repair exonuclease [Planococcus sp. CP5-4_YE]MBV0910043.1 DNA repair exonuclease [Planococcus sp. CP5-4_UN]MBW6064577.1 DNA repair exonuclease [Planococcus sp. CP5-4]